MHDVLAQSPGAGDEDDVAEALSVSSVNATPLAARSARTIFITPTDCATLK